MSAILAVATIVAFLWSAYHYEMVHKALTKWSPPEFQEGLTAKFVVPVTALNPSTALPLQRAYMKCLAGGWLAIFCFSLWFFSIGEQFGGWLMMAGFFLTTVSTIKSWMTYTANCNRPSSDDDGKEL